MESSEREPLASEEMVAAARRPLLSRTAGSTSKEMVAPAHHRVGAMGSHGEMTGDVLKAEHPTLLTDDVTSVTSTPPMMPLLRQDDISETPWGRGPTRRDRTRPGRPQAMPPAPFDVSPRRFGRVVVLVGLAVMGLVLAFVVTPISHRFATFGGEEPDPAPASPVAATTTVLSGGAAIPELVNLAIGQPVSASGEYLRDLANRAVDGNPKTAWNSGGYALQWIIIDLESEATIYSVRLQTGQNPAGTTSHRIVAWASDIERRVLHEFEGYTSDSQWLRYEPENPVPGIQYIAIETVRSPSWVSWFEIEINGHLD